MKPNKRATVAVVIPFSGRTAFLRQAIISVLQQSKSADEILIVNDSRSGMTLKELQKFLFEFEKCAPQLRCIQSTRPPGPGGTRNYGLLQSKSQFVAFLDDDDLFLPWKLESQVEKMVALDAQMSHGDYLRFEDESHHVEIQDTSRHSSSTDFLRKLPWRDCVIATPTVMVSRDLPERDLGIFPENINFGEDQVGWMNFLHSSNGKLIHLNEPLSMVRIHSKSLQREGHEASQVELRIQASQAIKTRYAELGLTPVPFEPIRRLIQRLLEFIFNKLGKPEILSVAFKKFMVLL